MLYNLVVDGVETKVILSKENLKFESNGTKSSKYAYALNCKCLQAFLHPSFCNRTESANDEGLRFQTMGFICFNGL